jgi:hypothetical protein
METFRADALLVYLSLPLHETAPDQGQFRWLVRVYYECVATPSPRGDHTRTSPAKDRETVPTCVGKPSKLGRLRLFSYLRAWLYCTNSEAVYDQRK